jgi:hypothetical protein
MKLTNIPVRKFFALHTTIWVYDMQPPIRSQQVQPFNEDPLSYSRVSTWLQCGHKGHQVYDLGFVPGTEASHNIQGHLVHSVVELLHRQVNVWLLSRSQMIEMAHSILDKLWAKQLGGREELAFMKNYISTLDQMYTECKKRREKQTGQTCKAPWMTKMWATEYKPQIQAKDKYLLMFMQRMNYVEFEPLPNIFKNTYQFVESYCKLIYQEFYEPEELYLEYEDDPLVVFEGVFGLDIGLRHAFRHSTDRRYALPFRGAIDQIWFAIAANGEDIYLYDVKTSRSGFTLDKVRYHDQLFLYATHIYQEYGRVPDRMGIIDVRKPEIVEIRPTLEDLEAFKRRWLMKLGMYSIMKHEKFYPFAVGDPMALCSYCEVGNHGICPEFKPTTVPFTPNSVPKGEPDAQ